MKTLVLLVDLADQYCYHFLIEGDFSYYNGLLIAKYEDASDLIDLLNDKESEIKEKEWDYLLTNPEQHQKTITVYVAE